jgi:hypothetical protein
MSSLGQPKTGGPPAWGLGEMLTNPGRKDWLCYEPRTTNHEHFPRAWIGTVVQTKKRESDVRFGTWLQEVGCEACSTYGGEGRCIQDFGGETWRKESTWETQA